MSVHKANVQAVLVSQPSINQNQILEEHAFFDSKGQPIILAATYSVTTTDAATATAKTTTSVEPPANSYVMVKYAATNGNTVVHTLAFSGGTARTIYLGGAAPGAGKHTVAQNGIVGYWFDGTILHQLGSM
jgi:hypothetical protein